MNVLMSNFTARKLAFSETIVISSKLKGPSHGESHPF